MKIIREGQTGIALAEKRGRVPVVYEYRTLTLDSGVEVKDVLVGVDQETGEILTLPAQSTPKVTLAREARKEETFSVRIPTELGDVLWGVSYELGANPTKFSSAVIRFYLNEAADTPRVAKRLKRLAMTELASATSRSRLTIRSETELLRRVKVVEAREGVSRSELVRGAVVAAKEDVFDRPVKSRLAQLRAIAEAV